MMTIKNKINKIMNYLMIITKVTKSSLSTLLLVLMGSLLLTTCGLVQLLIPTDLFDGDEKLLENLTTRGSAERAALGYFNGTVVIVGTKEAILTSKDGGFTWVNNSTGNDTFIRYSGVVYYRDLKKFCIGGTYQTIRGDYYWSGASRQSENGTSWSSLSSGSGYVNDVGQLSYGLLITGGYQSWRRRFMIYDKIGASVIEQNAGAGDITLAAADNGTLTVVTTKGRRAYIITNSAITATSIPFTQTGVTFQGNASSHGQLLDVENIRGSTNFIAVGTSGNIYTSENGITWQRRNAAASVTLNAVTTRKKNTTYGTSDVPLILICGNGGTILKSADGGITWASRASGTSVNLNDIIFLGDTPIVLLVGDNGLTLLSTNNGDSWTKIPNVLEGTDKHLLDIAYANPEAEKLSFELEPY